MEKSEKAPVKANSSAPDLAFYQLKMEKENGVIGFMEKESEEHVGKLSRKGGEILLPGVIQQKPRLADDPNRMSKVEMIVDVPNSETETETFLFSDGSTGEFRRLVKEGSDQARKTAGTKIVRMTDSRMENREFFQFPNENIPSDASEIILQTEQLTNAKEVAEEDSQANVPSELDERVESPPPAK